MHYPAKALLASALLYMSLQVAGQDMTSATSMMSSMPDVMTSTSSESSMTRSNFASPVSTSPSVSPIPQPGFTSSSSTAASQSAAATSNAAFKVQGHGAALAGVGLLVAANWA